MRRRKVLSLLICISIIAMMFVPLVGTVTVSAADGKTVYVASTGSDSNNGSESAPFATFEKAWNNSDTGEYTIVIVDEAVLGSSSFSLSTSNKASHTTVKGATASSVLDLSVKTTFAVRSSGGLTFDNITLKFTTDTIFAANGKTVVVTETVTMPNRIRIFGGGHNESVSGDTNLTVLGGSYNRIYGGGNGGGVGGNVNLTIGGNVNSGDGIDDEVSNPAISPCQVYGGSYNGTVSGNVTVNFGGNAVTRYLSANGAGTGAINGTATVNMTGGKATTVCGTRSYAMTDAKIFLNITGGLVESVFGGAEGTNVSGDVQIYLGANADVSRRVFGGCYNDTNIFSFKTSYHITGSITVLVDKGAKVGSGTGLSSANKLDMGLYGSSRYSSAFSDEICTLVFLNGNSSSNYKLGGAYSDRSDYKVTVGQGGTVKSAMNGTASLVMAPDDGKCAVIGSEKLGNGAIHTLSASSTSITFAEIIKYNITLNANNGTDAFEALEKIEGIDLTLPSVNATNGDLEFIGWALSADAKTPDYNAGDKYTDDKAMVLYAVWRGKPQKYNVMHLIGSGNDVKVLKVEKLTGYVGELTEAVPMEKLGYTASVVQETIVKNEAVTVVIIYTRGDYALGDVNCDGSVDPLDEAIFARFLDGWDGYNAEMLCDYTVDCTADGNVDSDDCTFLARCLAGWIGYTFN